MPPSLYDAHVSSFSALDSGKLSFRECWSEQSDILDRAEAQLREQIRRLKLLQSPLDSEPIKDIATVTSVPVVKPGVEAYKKTKQEQVEDITKHTNKPPIPTKTWSAGILTNFLKDCDQSDKNSSKASDSDKMISCPVCSNYSSPHLHVLKDHIEAKHLEVRFACTHCSDKWNYKKKCFKHIRSITNDAKKVSSMIKYKCGQCKGSQEGLKTEFSTHVMDCHPIFKDIYCRTTSLTTETNKAPAKSEKKGKPLNESNAALKPLKPVKKEENTEDVSSFLTEMETNLQKFSKLINDSMSENEADEEKPQKVGPSPAPAVVTNAGRKNKCFLCREDFSGERYGGRKLWTHLDQKHKLVRYSCNKCDFVKTSRQSLTVHINDTHSGGNTSKEHLEEIRKEVSRSCPYCSFKVKNDGTPAELVNHLCAEHKAKLKKVKGITNTTDVVKAAQEKKEKIEDNLKKEKESKTCPRCNFKTTYYWNLKKHFASHLGTSFDCTLCQTTFRTKFDLSEHLKSTHEDKTLKMKTTALDEFMVLSCEDRGCNVKRAPIKDYDKHLISSHGFPTSE